ncbi:hypothetical protein TNCV_5085031 [Trichonephila clavipes]|uniref:Uncharacterized protein n=1 Tax=Trichonephila clavipes TaxID=2585209 RepID=A0A8X6S6B3_TRICX|nr:hypothetical protein TNCV_5085031 [Trichonephila clavipes]
MLNHPFFWEALPEQDLTFDDYLLVDTDIAVWGALSDAEIVALDHNNTENDEDESEELTPVTLSKAKVSLNKLRNFFFQNHVDADILQASFVLEKPIDKIESSQIFCKRDPTAYWGAQRKSLRKWKYQRKLRKVSSLGYGNDFKLTEKPVDVTVQITPEIQHRMKTDVRQ